MTCDLDCTSTPDKTFIFGVNSFTGHFLLTRYRTYYPETSGSASSENDLYPVVNFNSPDISHLALDKKGYECAIICAAITSVAKCEADTKESYAVNVTGTLSIIQQLCDMNIRPIFLSSDYVFDGKDGSYTDDASVNPLNAYGAQKAEVEEAIPRICGDNYLILRLSKLFSVNNQSNSFLNDLLSQLLSGKQVRAAYDQIFCPTLIDDVANVLFHLQQNNCKGLFNVCSPDTLSRYDLALKTAAQCNSGTASISRISIDDLDEHFKRPHNTSMCCNRLTAAITPHFSSIDNCIYTLVNNRRNNHG